MVGGGWEKKTPSEERVHQSLSLTAFGVDCDVLIGWIGKFNFKVYHSPDNPLRLYPLEINH